MSVDPVEVGESERSILLVEYQCAQASAEHHDSIIWTTTGIIWGASLILIGLALDASTKMESRFFIFGLALVAIFLHCFVWVVQIQLRKIKIEKYNRCKEIETRLSHMSQHTSLKHHAASHTFLYGVIQLLFIVSWAILGGFMLCGGAS